MCCPRPHERLIQEITEPRRTAKELEASLASVQGQCSWQQERHCAKWHHGRVPRPKPLLSKKNKRLVQHLLKTHHDDPLDFWKIFCGLTRQNLPTVKHDGCFLPENPEKASQVFFFTSNTRTLRLCSRTLIRKTWESPPLNGSKIKQN